ncbi:transient receptor potential cation channel subfamily M member 6-like [Paramuricea clavata]|uniref:Transient receptor potential cation channel subfamily M member 6-like n=1 Tax=Paramuricea clavata TaxID=317549 RepID=A0A6S7I2L2_PARCT|nr:transient receptor potential cation channel subfamily M member 6-like [Paramuricea clavata]
MHMLARNFAWKLDQHIEKEDIREMFGQTLKFKKVYLGKIQDNKCVTVEGTFKKYLNNNGMLCDHDTSTLQKKCENLAHFLYEQSNHELIIVDMQGSGYSLFDPEIASKNLRDGDELLFSTGNLSIKWTT